MVVFLNMILTLISWNVSGLIQRMEKGELGPVLHHNPEIVCFQETRMNGSDISERLRPLYGYHSWFSELPQERYSNVGMISRLIPRQVSFGLGDPRTDGVGRAMMADLEFFTLINASVPSGDGESYPMKMKLAFLDGLLDAIARLREQGRPVVLCGDLNVAHTDRDLWDAKTFDPEKPKVTEGERSRLDRLAGLGFVDPLRAHGDRPDAFTWWHTGHGIWQQKRGMRLDYFFVSPDLKCSIRNCAILSGIRGSDHFPILLELEIPEAVT